jgi:hypothetical protein
MGRIALLPVAAAFVASLAWPLRGGRTLPRIAVILGVLCLPWPAPHPSRPSYLCLAPLRCAATGGRH